MNFVPHFNFDESDLFNGYPWDVTWTLDRLAAIGKLHLSPSRRNGAGLPAASTPEGQPSASLSQDVRNGSAGWIEAQRKKSICASSLFRFFVH